MSFAFAAKGSRADVLGSLGYQQVSGPLGARVMQLAIETMRDAPPRSGERDLVYSVSANGHSDALGATVPSVALVISAEYAQEGQGSLAPQAEPAGAGELPGQQAV